VRPEAAKAIIQPSGEVSEIWTTLLNLCTIVTNNWLTDADEPCPKASSRFEDLWHNGTRTNALLVSYLSGIAALRTSENSDMAKS
jgi:hypothetical protein